LYGSGWVLFDQVGANVDTKANDEALEPTLQFMNVRLEGSPSRESYQDSEPNALSCTNISSQ